MMEAVRISETLVYFNETAWRYIPVDYHLQVMFHLLWNSKAHYRVHSIQLLDPILS
jgi:hypothetical protein